MATCGHPQCRDLTACVMPQVIYYPNSFGTVHWYQATPQGWICPRCGRVYGPTAFECWFCNKEPKPGGAEPGETR